MVCVAPALAALACPRWPWRPPRAKSCTPPWPSPSAHHVTAATALASTFRQSFFSGTLQHNEWHLVPALQLHVGTMEKMGQSSFDSTALQPGKILVSPGNSLRGSSFSFGFTNQFAMAACNSTSWQPSARSLAARGPKSTRCTRCTRCTRARCAHAAHTSETHTRDRRPRPSLHTCCCLAWPCTPP